MNTDRTTLAPGTFTHTLIAAMLGEAQLTRCVVDGFKRMGATDEEAAQIIVSHGWCSYNPDGCPDPDAYRDYVHGRIDYAAFLERLTIRHEPRA